MRGHADRNARMSRLALGLCALSVALASTASPAELQTLDEIQACLDANFPQDSSVQTVSMQATDRIGAVTETRAKMYWKKFDNGRSRVMMRFSKPADLRGAGLLMIENEDRNDMFIYLPELGRIKRVTSRMTSSSMFGTDFSYEEFERLQGLSDTSQRARGEDASVNDRPAYTIELKPDDAEESAYERIRLFVDKETCILARADFYERGDQPRKTLTTNPAKISREGDLWMAREIMMRDFRDETETTMVVEKIEVGASIPRKIFSQSALESGGN